MLAELALYELKRDNPMSVQGAATLTANILVGRPHYVQLLIVGVDESGPSVYSIDSAGGYQIYTVPLDRESLSCMVSGRSVFQGHDEKGCYCSCR